MNLANQRIAKALDVALHHAQTDGAHHKMWVIDQMVRALLGEPPQKEPPDPSWLPDSYREFVATHNYGESGPNTFAWDEGTPP